jgi:hypothetical protein
MMDASTSTGRSPNHSSVSHRRIGLAARAAMVAALGIAGATTQLHAQGTIVAWGGYEPVEPPAGTFTAVAAGFYNNTAIRSDGSLVEWPNVGVAPAGSYTDVAVAKDYEFGVALRADGTLVNWGYDAWGLPVPPAPDGSYTAIAAGGTIGLAIGADGTLSSWGTGFFSGQPAAAPPEGTFIDVAAYDDIGVAIRTDGSLASWDLGDGFGQPLPPPSGTYSHVAVGYLHAVAIRTDGTLRSWALRTYGGNTYGQLSGTPAGTFTAVAAGGDHSVAIRDDGTLVSWGRDTHGQVSNTPAGTYSAVAAAGSHSIAITGTTNEPPVIICNDPAVLWSPDHGLVDVGSAVSIFDPDEDALALTIRIFSDETEIPDTGDGTSKHAPDFKDELYDGGRGLLVRSERRGAEDGRFYVAVITADDGNGGVTTGVCPVAVCPRQQTEESLGDVLDQAYAGAAYVLGLVDAGTLPASPGAPAGLSEHGLSEALGPNQ